MHHYLVDWLQCPACHGALVWTLNETIDDRIETAEARCTGCDATYPVREGIGVFLTPDLPRNDLWEQVDSGLTRHLRENPTVGRALMDVPPETLNPADRFFRMLVLEERGQFDAARALKDSTLPALYTKAYNLGWQQQIDYVIDQLRKTSVPIVDLASGRGYLVEHMVRQLPNYVVATDFSPRVLRRNQTLWRHLGLYDRVSQIAFDARRTPFKNGAVSVMTSNLGLPNIEHPGDLVRELRRVVAEHLLSVMHFFPEHDAINAATICEQGLDTMLYAQRALAVFQHAGWQVALENAFTGPASPTPHGEIIPSGVDGLPVADTMLTWAVLVAE